MHQAESIGINTLLYISIDEIEMNGCEGPGVSEARVVLSFSASLTFYFADWFSGPSEKHIACQCQNISLWGKW